MRPFRFLIAHVRRLIPLLLAACLLTAAFAPVAAASAAPDWATEAFVYRDGFFAIDSSIRNDALAYAAMNMAGAAYDPDAIAGLLESLGFDKPETYNYDHAASTGEDYVAYAFAHKYVLLDGRRHDLFVIAVRGSATADDWQSNFNLGIFVPDHAGFSGAAAEVEDSFWKYYKTLLIDGVIDFDETNNKFLITGHSRGAAVANLVAARDDLPCAEKDLFAYTFACPLVTKNEAERDLHPNIFNYIISTDAVPQLPPTFERYGAQVFLYAFSDGYDAMREGYGRREGVPFVLTNSVQSHAGSAYLAWMEALAAQNALLPWRAGAEPALATPRFDDIELLGDRGEGTCEVFAAWTAVPGAQGYTVFLCEPPCDVLTVYGNQRIFYHYVELDELLYSDQNECTFTMAASDGLYLQVAAYRVENGQTVYGGLSPKQFVYWPANGSSGKVW